jgi:hypothetical protein
VLFYEEYKWRGRKERWQNGSKVYVLYEKRDHENLEKS